ncbi:MAG TPA: hypothetical protein VGB19_14030 [Actinomycetota bacterium]
MAGDRPRARFPARSRRPDPGAPAFAEKGIGTIEVKVTPALLQALYG